MIGGPALVVRLSHVRLRMEPTELGFLNTYHLIFTSDLNIVNDVFNCLDTEFVGAVAINVAAKFDHQIDQS